MSIKLYLLGLLGLFNKSGATRVVALDICSAFERGLHPGFFFTNFSLMEFQVRYLALFLFFSIIDGFKWLWMGNRRKNIQLMLQFHLLKME